jgi:heptosyltransferase III
LNSSPTRATIQDNAPDAVIIARYRKHYRRQDALVSAFDFLLRLAIWSGSKKEIPKRPERILLANAGYLGDAIISTALFPVIKHAFPEASIGFLTGGYSRAAIEGHPLLNRTHYLDHWYASREQATQVRKAAKYYLRTSPAMVKELRGANYDIAIDLHAWFPSFVPLLWLARIPIRIGFSRVGFSPLLTHAQTYNYDRRHEMEHQLDLLRPWALARESLDGGRPTAPAIPETTMDHVRALIGSHTRYRVLHPASSTSVRDWTIEGWSSLARHMLEEGITPVISGTGPRDEAMAQAICRMTPGAISTVGKLSWQQLMALLYGAELVYSVETSIGHAAAALGRPVVSIYGGMADPKHWSPLGATVVTNALPCFPCFDKRGCTHRSCIVGITVQDVEGAAANLPTST